MAHSDATGSTMMLLPIVGGLAAAGIDPNVVLSRYGMSIADLADDDLRIADAKITPIWNDAITISGDPNIGFGAAKLYRRGMFRVLDYVIASAPTLGDSLQRGTRYLSILHDLADLQVEREGELGAITAQLRPTIPLPPAQEDFFMAMITVLSRQLTGLDETPHEVRFRHARPADTSPADGLFRCPVLYGQERTQTVFPMWFLEVECINADSVLAKVVGEHAERIIARLPPQETFVTQVQRVLAERIADDVSVERVARVLHTSPRTLRRRLTESGTGFKEVLADLRETMAKRYIDDKRLTLDEIAWLLGFSNTSAFHRAFKRWTGSTPDAYRKSA
jgi:AraC-like DNA-binding protein